MGGLDSPTRARLEALFEGARQAGDLGPGPVARHVDHALALASCLDGVPSSFLDLGSGAGVPGLVLALLWAESEAVLLEAQAKRAARLDAAMHELGLAGRARVVPRRAEEAGRDPELREAFDLVVARAFEGGPAVTAECATGFLRAGGRLLVSEPPGVDETRWPEDGVAQLGFGAAERLRAEGATAAVLRKERPAADRWPRRTGIPAKRPLW